MPEEFTLPSQLLALHTLLSRKVDGIAVSAVDRDGLADFIREAAAAGVPVISFDSPAQDTVAFVGTDQKHAGYAAGAEFARELENKGAIIVLQGSLAAPTLNDRFEGFRSALREIAPEIVIVAREETQSRSAVATSHAEALLNAHPDVAGIFCMSSEGVPGVAAYLRTKNPRLKVILAGFDDTPESLAAIGDGLCRFAVVQKTYAMGWEALTTLERASEKKAVEKTVDTGVKIIRKENLESYSAEIKKEFAK